MEKERNQDERKENEENREGIACPSSHMDMPRGGRRLSAANDGMYEQMSCVSGGEGGQNET